MKIFGIGLNKTGTKTLGICLQHLGYRHTSYNFDDLKRFNEGDFDFLFEKMRQFDSCEDWPWPLMFEFLDEKFPDGKFILTKRKTPEIWFESLCKHADCTGPKEARKITYGYEMPHQHRLHHIDFYNAHYRKVVDYFKDKPNKLLVVCWEDGDGWQQLCRFLGKSVPDILFPHVNEASAMFMASKGNAQT
jgi:hypothetical protein